MADVKKMATREGYGKGLVALGAEHADVVVLDADLAGSTKTGMFAKAYPDRHFNCGIAEADMKLRGPGDMDGTMQSGLPFTLRIANLSNDGIVLQQARTDVQEILQSDPLLAAPQHAMLLSQLKYRATDAVNWSLIS